MVEHSVQSLPATVAGSAGRSIPQRKMSMDRFPIGLEMDVSSPNFQVSLTLLSVTQLRFRFTRSAASQISPQPNRSDFAAPPGMRSVSQDFSLDRTACQAHSPVVCVTPSQSDERRCQDDSTQEGSAGYRLTSGVHPARIQVVEVTAALQALRLGLSGDQGICPFRAPRRHDVQALRRPRGSRNEAPGNSDRDGSRSSGNDAGALGFNSSQEVPEPI